MALPNFQFRTELQIDESPVKISLNTPILTVGSCFADAIGSRLAASKVPTLVNPFGTIFNPVSIEKCIVNILDNQEINKRLYFQNQTVWFHHDWHSSFWGNTQEQLEQQLETQAQNVVDWIDKTKFLIITLGTAFVYRHLATGQIVSNCHKVPSQMFQRELLSVEQVVESVANICRKIKIQAPDLQIVLTVSPVRHTRDTLPLNAVSKSVLRVACHELTRTLKDVQYFPAYELLLDDLRDYRFYKPDLIHPTETAEDYIFEHFATAYFDQSLKDFLREWQKVRQALAHRPLQSNTAAHYKFLENLLEKLHILNHTTNMTAEIATCKQQLSQMKL